MLKIKEEKRMRKFRIIVAFVALMFSLGVAPVVAAQARSLTILEMLQTEERVETRVEPSENAEVGKVYEAGDILLIVEGGNEQWHAVAYQGNIYYVKKEETVNLKTPVIQVEDVENNATKEVVLDEHFKEELNAEMEVGVHEGKAYIESFTRYQEETKQKRIWGAIIGVLVVAIFGVSIYSYVFEKKNSKEK